MLPSLIIASPTQAVHPSGSRQTSNARNAPAINNNGHLGAPNRIPHAIEPVIEDSRTRRKIETQSTGVLQNYIDSDAHRLHSQTEESTSDVSLPVESDVLHTHMSDHADFDSDSGSFSNFQLRFNRNKLIIVYTSRWANRFRTTGSRSNRYRTTKSAD